MGGPSCPETRKISESLDIAARHGDQGVGRGLVIFPKYPYESMS